jgi:hypothetical protein
MNPDTIHAVVQYVVRHTLQILDGVVWCVYGDWGVAVT